MYMYVYYVCIQWKYNKCVLVIHVFLVHVQI